MNSFMKSGNMKLIKLSSRVAATLALSILTLPAPAMAAPTRPIRFDRLSLEQGLSQSGVMDVLQDRRGYIWLSTGDGLDRYDGTSFKVYRHDAADASSLPDSFVWETEEDGAGNLWVATRGGLAMWERATDRMRRQGKLGNRHIRALRYAAKDNDMWIGTRDAGLYRLELATGELTAYAHDANQPASLVSDQISTLYVDRQDHLWVGTDNGLDRLDAPAADFVHFAPDAGDPGSLSDGHVRTVLQDDTGAVWVAKVWVAGS